MQIDDAKKREYINCVRTMKAKGYSEIEAQIHCAQKFNDEEVGSSSILPYYFFNSEPKADPKCVAKKMHIINEEHPDWSQEHKLGFAYGWCRQHQMGDIDETSSTNKINPTKNISISSFAHLVKTLRQKTLKVKNGALGPFKVGLPMKNLSRLQTKLKQLTTEEAKYLTAEQLQARAAYASLIKKDSTSEEIDNNIIEAVSESIARLIEENKEKSDDEKEDLVFDYLTNPNPWSIWVDGEVQVEYDKVNTSLNNIIKVPIILAREIIQPYKYIDEETGEIIEEKHFKPYEELKDSIEGLDRLYMILEHKKQWDKIDTLGCVRQLRADDEDRSIKGMGYFVRSKLPTKLLEILDAGLPFGVSIGFMADLGGGGEFNGEHYDFTQRHIILDHLAICLDSRPRCKLPLCGGNVTEDSEDITIINKGNNYYIIDTNFVSKTTNTNKNMASITDSVDPKSGELEGNAEGEDLKLYMGKFRAYINGEILEDKWKLHFEEILAILKGEKKQMNDEEVKQLLDSQQVELIEKMSKIWDIRKLTDSYSESELTGKSLAEIRGIHDAVTKFAPSNEKAPVIEKKAGDVKAETPKIEAEDGEVEEEEYKYTRIDPTTIFDSVTKEFNMKGI